MQTIDILFKYILWNEFLNDLDATMDLKKKICHKKPALKVLREQARAQGLKFFERERERSQANFYERNKALSFGYVYVR